MLDLSVGFREIFCTVLLEGHPGWKIVHERGGNGTESHDGGARRGVATPPTPAGLPVIVIVRVSACVRVRCRCCDAGLTEWSLYDTQGCVMRWLKGLRATAQRLLRTRP